MAPHVVAVAILASSAVTAAARLSTEAAVACDRLARAQARLEAVDEPTDGDRADWDSARAQVMGAIDEIGWKRFADAADAQCAEAGIRGHAEAAIRTRPEQAVEELTWHAAHFRESPYGPAVRTFLLPVALLNAEPPHEALSEITSLLDEAPDAEKPLIALRLVDALAMTGNSRAARRSAARFERELLPKSDDALRPWIASQLAAWKRHAGRKTPPWVTVASAGSPDSSPAEAVTILELVAPWCAVCEPVSEELAELSQRMPPGALRVVQVASDKDVAVADGGELPSVTAMRERMGNRHPLVVVRAADFDRFSATSLPLILLTDRRGIVRHVWSGSGGTDVLGAAVRAASQPRSTP